MQSQVDPAMMRAAPDSERGDGCARMVRSCRLCAFPSCTNLGRVYNSVGSFSGSWSIDGAESFHLYWCPRCDFQFKDPPVIPPVRLDDYYANGAFTECGGAYERRFDTLQEITTRYAPGRRVLDVGCSTGDLLRSFDSSWQKFGVEPSSHTSAIARESGINVLAPTLTEIPPDLEPFDAILLIDVAEHVVDPLPMFQGIRRRLRHGGVCIVMTLDTAAPTWRLERSLHWYCSLPEHVSFYSQGSMAEIERRAGFEAVEHRRVTHARLPATRALSEFCRNIGFMVLERTGGMGIGQLGARVARRPAPSWSTARDHMIRVMKASPQGNDRACGKPDLSTGFQARGTESKFAAERNSALRRRCGNGDGTGEI